MRKLLKIFKKKKETKINTQVAIPLAILVGIFLGWLGFYANTPNIEFGEDRALVETVIDGDTFRVPGDERIRILGINAPDKGECYYSESREALKNLIEGKIVRLDEDVENRDKYGRLLRYIFLEQTDKDNILINDYLVRQGFAFEYHLSPNSRYRNLLVSAREEAKRENRGLWKDCDYREEEENLRSQDEEPIDPNCIIKGNISEKSFGRTYLVPGCDNYERVKIDTSKGEMYFCSEEEAEEAGFRKATNCP